MKKKILIVEDNKDSGEMLRLFITKIGHHPIKRQEQRRSDHIRGGRATGPHFYGYGTAGCQWSQLNGSEIRPESLAGTDPMNLRVETVDKFELGINLKTAKALGPAIPQSVLYLADQVIG